ncbi:MAG: acyl-CoA dehydrogenase C-terminal domain-containing protein [Rhodospirillales bacterium]|nr:acyl-CoA dehydrogenase C-terminal domain-containing protein [Rhodospirillales bacterium]
MSTYVAPVEEMRFVLDELAEMETLSSLPGYEEATTDLVDAILEEAGKFASGVLDPINASGDREGAKLENGVVRAASGFADAYQQFVEGGWNGICMEPDFGGQGLPAVLGTTVQEMWAASNMAFELCPLLSKGAMELLSEHASDDLKSAYLPKMVSGEWTGTMNLTEPQAGSDLAQVKTRAVRDGDTYRITGQKIFITWGEHDMAENIVHLVLARLPDAPPGIKGVSLFLVPKFMVNEDGSLGDRNDLRCVSLEHKLGINASPTCVMSFGDDGGATGYLVGQENAGIACMFTMMNSARLSVGLEGVAMAERAYQRARDYAKERVQSPVLGSGDSAPAPIIRHADVRRMLLTMKAQTEASRALSYFVSSRQDVARRHPDAETRQAAGALVALLTPVAKAWSSDIGIDVANTGVQVHGGMGFIEETGAAQHLRDVRITAIYEGTNGIQANDLIGRKVARENGVTIKALIARMRELDGDLAKAPEQVATMRNNLSRGISALEKATDWLLATYASEPARAAAGSVPYLRLTGIVVGGWLMARAALAAAERLANGDGNPAFMQGKIATARFFADTYLPEAEGLVEIAATGGAMAVDMAEDLF